MSQPKLVAMVGTFDVSNFGDLLFPLLAQRELERRLPGVEIRRYSYRRMKEGEWPYEVRSLNELADDLAGAALLIVGGGHLVRFDDDVAYGYEPTEPGTHHPTGYWLTPTLLARAYGVPVAWNAVGVSPDPPEWARSLLAEAMTAADYVSVRDEPSADALAAVAPQANVRIVPDTAWGIEVGDEARSERTRFLAELGVSEPYVVVQPSPQLVHRADMVRAAVAAARDLGRSVVELPVSPALGDRVGLFDLPDVAQPRDWPSPDVFADIIANADAVIAQSLHMSIVALAAGVPVHRLPGPSRSKYEALETVPGVVVWNGDADAAAAMRNGVGRQPPGQHVAERLAALAAHWDAVAELAGTRREPDRRLTARLIASYTAMLESSGERAREAVEAAERSASETVRAQERLLAEERSTILRQLDDAERDRALLMKTEEELRRLSGYTRTLLSSPSYRVTAPLRALRRIVRRR